MAGMRKSLQRSQNCGGMKAAVGPRPHSPGSQINPLLVPQNGELGAFRCFSKGFGYLLSHAAGNIGRMQIWGSKSPFLPRRRTLSRPLRRKRRRRRSTHLDAVQRSDAHVQKDAVEHRHGDVLGTWKKHGAHPKEGGSSFPAMGTSDGGHGRGWKSRFFSPGPQKSAGRERGWGNGVVLPSRWGPGRRKFPSAQRR